RVDDGIASYKKALALKPDYAEAHYNAGNAFSRKGLADEAIAHYRRALELQSDYPEADLNLGVALARQGRGDDAVAHFQRALEMKPDYAEAHYNLGIALFQRGRADDAVAHFRRALEIQPDYAEAHHNLGIALLSQGRVREAVVHYQRALEIHPQSASWLNDLAWVLATCPEASLRDSDRAIALARRANELAGGGNPMILRTLAAACANAGQFTEATDAAGHALRLAAGNAALADALHADLQLYRSGLPLRDDSLKSVPADSRQ
ncbi:MAG: tetratricopeptide repeat protein, partial [Terrimicrobiaceae bacterium]|nr:tetratricopeptide repeat protein [Terrimicrobiaceae bacterium]